MHKDKQNKNKKIKKNSSLSNWGLPKVRMKKLKLIIKKKNQKRPIEFKLGLKKITNFTSQSINKVYKNFKKKTKNWRKKWIKN